MTEGLARRPPLPGRQGQDATHTDDGAGQWRAELALRFEYRAGRTVLVQRRHRGPLCVQKPFYPEGEGVCHTYLLHPPAGIVGGDSLNIELSLQENAHALVTTPAATRFYRANPLAGTLSQAIHLQAAASLEWLPQENIVFNGAAAEITTRLYLEKDCRLFAWDSLCLGRPASAEVFDRGYCRQRLEIWLAQEPLFIDALHLDARSRFQQARWGLAGAHINSLLLVYPATVADLALVNQSILPVAELQCAASLVDSLLVVRTLALDTEAVQLLMRRVWQLLRPGIMGRPACPPRVWNT